MSDIYFDALSHDTTHWRYWKYRVSETEGGFRVRMFDGSEKVLLTETYPRMKTSHDASLIASHFGRVEGWM